MRDPRQRRAARRAGVLAIGAMLMVALALTAAFAPIPGKHPATAHAGLHAAGPPLARSLHPLKSPWPSPSPGYSAAAPAPAPGFTTTYPAAPRPQAGEFCPVADHGLSRLAGSGGAVICQYNNGWRWEPVPAAAAAPTPSPPKTYPPPPPSPTPPPGADLPPPLALTEPLEGVVTDSVGAWNANTSSQAELAGRFVSMARPLAPTWLHSLMRSSDGAEPVIEITPTAPGQPSVSLADITAGKRDGWLKDLRDQITALGRPVVVSFAPEANGDWYAWGQDPAGFRAAWHHVHSVLDTSGVTWEWQVSAHNPGEPATQDIGDYWPGPSDVDWVGLDGYYYFPGNTFDLRFKASLDEVKGFWGGPILIAETAVSPAVGDGAAMAADITDLFAGVAADPRLIGLVYLDLKPNGGGFYHPDFRLERYPAALAAYSKAVNGSW